MPHIIYLLLSAIVPFIWSLSPFFHFTVQLIALLIIFAIYFYQKNLKVFIYLVSGIICLSVFTTHGLNSPVFFLIYFLLFVVAFQNPPSTTLSFSLLLIILLSQTLSSSISLITLSSLLLITPLAWFVGRQYLQSLKDQNLIADTQTNTLLWISLKFKTGITAIADLASQILSSPSLSHQQRESLKKIRESAHSLLNSSEKLEEIIENDSENTKLSTN